MKKESLIRKIVYICLIAIFLISNLSIGAFAQSYEMKKETKQSTQDTSGLLNEMGNSSSMQETGVSLDEETNSSSTQEASFSSTEETTPSSTQETSNSSIEETNSSSTQEISGPLTEETIPSSSSEVNEPFRKSSGRTSIINDEFNGGKVDFNNQFYASFLSTSSSPVVGTPYKIDGGKVELGNGDMQTLALTSQFKLDFKRSFEINGNLTIDMGHLGQVENKSNHSGFAVSFHTFDNNYNVLNTGGSLGVYRDIAGPGSNMKEQGLGLAVVVEVDPIKSYGTIDQNVSDSHIAINETDYDGEINSFGTPELMDTPTIIGTKGKFNIKWNSKKNEITFRHGANNVKVVKKTITSDLVNLLKKTGVYVTFSGSIGTYYKGVPIKFNVNKIAYNDTNPKVDISFSKLQNGEEVEITDNDVLGEEEEVTVRYKINNEVSTSTGTNSTIQLSKNVFKEEYGLDQLNISDATTASWYKPYIIKDSIKTYVGNTPTNDNAINMDNFFAGQAVPITLEANKQVRTIEYKVKLPKVLGENKNSLNTEIKVGDTGTSIITKNRQLFLQGSSPVSVPDINLKSSLVESIVNKISDVIRPTDLNEKIYEKEMLVLDQLNLNKKNIADLTGIEFCKNLWDLNIANNKITDLSPLMNIEKLQKLNISGNNKPANIEKLEQLKNLFVNNARVDDSYLNLISQLKNLEVLQANSNRIVDVSPVAKLKKLSRLRLDNNKISDIRAIKEISEQLVICTLVDQNVSIKESYVEGTSFSIKNFIYDFDSINDDIVDSGEYSYNRQTKKIVWDSILSGTQQIQYKWDSNPRIRYSGTVTINLNTTFDPSYLVDIPSKLTLGEVLDENSEQYDAETDPTSPDYDPNKNPGHKNPVVKGMVGSKELMTLKNEQGFEGTINVYVDSTCALKNKNNENDVAETYVYKTFNDKLSGGTAADKNEYLAQLTTANPKGVLRIKTNSQNFKTDNATYEGILKVVLEYVP